MNSEQVKRNLWRGTASNYVRVGVRMFLGLVTFRLLYQGLGTEEFGFWSLLWSVFGYGILLDFGFGYAAQKRVAELSVRKDWTTLSQVLSTIFFFYFLGAAVLVLLAVVCSGPLLNLFNVSPANREAFRLAMLVFIAGMGLALPMGIFPEVLRGQQRIDAANNIAMAGMLANFVCMALAVWLHWPFLVIIVLALLCVLGPDAAAMGMALRHMPGVRIGWSHFSRRQIVETSRFSIYAYLNMLSNVLRNKTDQVVISSMLSVQAVTPYQAGGKVGDMFNMLTRQLSDAISPAAATLHARGDRAALRDVLLKGMRFSVMTATPLYFVSAFYLEGLVRLLTGDRHPSAATLWVGQLMLFWYYSLAITHLIFKRMYMMAGQERRMMFQGVAEAGLNVALSIAATWWLRSIVGVAIGSVIPTLLFGWGLLWPWAAKEAGLSPWMLFQRIVLKTWVGSVPMLLLGAVFKLQPWWTSGGNTLLVLMEGAAVLVAGIAGLWRFSLTPEERARFQQTFARRLPVRFQRQAA